MAEEAIELLRAFYASGNPSGQSSSPCCRGAPHPSVCDMILAVSLQRPGREMGWVCVAYAAGTSCPGDGISALPDWIPA